ncbi:MAG: metallophosphoesterase family protein [Actinomycetota bacterium]
MRPVNAKRLTLAVALAIGLAGWMGAAPATAPAREGVPARVEAPISAPIRSAPSPASVPPERYEIGAAGDVACASDPESNDRPDNCQYDDTADLLVGLTGVLVLGDSQYETGGDEAFRKYYDPTWGRFLEQTFPVPGNHEYTEDPSATPNGYFRYFGDRVRGPDGLGYYSFDLPEGCRPGHGVCWHFIALSSELCFAGGGCGPATDPSDLDPGHRMYEWLKRDLRSHPNDEYPCTLAYWHHPLFSISDGSGATPATRPLWQLLYGARADVVVNGHSHNYQRWLPQDPFGTFDPSDGIREFVAGTGGASKYPLLPGAGAPNLAAAQDEAFGIVRFSLDRASYSREWVPAAGQPDDFIDESATTAACV